MYTKHRRKRKGRKLHKRRLSKPGGSRTTERRGTKTKVMPGVEHKPPKYKYPQRTKYHPRKKEA